MPRPPDALATPAPMPAPNVRKATLTTTRANSAPKVMPKTNPIPFRNPSRTGMQHSLRVTTRWRGRAPPPVAQLERPRWERSGRACATALAL